MAKQLYTAERICKLLNIQIFIYFLGENVVNSTKDLIKHIVELYTGLNHNIKTDKEDF